MGNTVKIHRVFAAPSDRVYRAFTDPDALAKWIPPRGYVAHVAHHDARVGGTFKMSFKSLHTGNANSFGGEFLEMVPGKRLRYTDQFDDPNLPGTLMVTVTFTDVACGTEVHVTQENVPEVIPIEMCYLGWQESMRQLADLVEVAAP